MLWILASDSVVAFVTVDLKHAALISTIKGWVFVVVTALMLYGLMKRMVDNLSDIHARMAGEREARLQALQMLGWVVNTSTDILAAKDIAGRYLLFNPAAGRLIGVDPELVIGRDDFAIFPSEQALARVDEDRQVMRERTVRTIEETVSTPGGVRTILTTKGPLLDEESQLIGVFAVGRDISERKRAEDKILQVNRTLRMLSACNMTLVYAGDESGLLREICRLIVEMGGYAMAWVGYAEWDDDKILRPVAHSGTGDDFLASIRVSWGGGLYGQGPAGSAVRTGETQINRHLQSSEEALPWRGAMLKEGYRAGIGLPLISGGVKLGALSVYSVETEAFPPDEIQLLEELARDLAFGIVTIRQRHAREEAERKVAFLTVHDSATGLPNRMLVADRFKMAMAYAGPRRFRAALLVVDVDNFKFINESVGHRSADELLRQIAQRLGGRMRDTDTLGRHGGDEFVVIAADIAGLEAVIGVAGGILQLFTDPFDVEGRPLQCSVSIGISVCPEDGEEFDDLLKKADAAMYHAKSLGRNTYCFFDRAMTEGKDEIIDLRQSLRRGLDRGEFVLHYQPQIDLASQRLVGVEALIRWYRPGHGMIPPGRFIPLAEESGQIVAIGKWVIGEACRQLAAWRQDGLNGLVAAVNLSALQFGRELEKTVMDALAAAGVEPEFLELELTESILIKDAEAAVQLVRRLKDLGLRLSIDDFGTGYSSLAYLKRFKPDWLKIDQSFVSDLLSNPDSGAIVRTITQMAENLGIGTIAEGVETEATAACLKTLGCDRAQGYFFGRPMRAEELVRWAREGGWLGPGR